MLFGEVLKDERIGESEIRKSNFALRLQQSLLDEAREERAARADTRKALDILKRAGKDNPLVKGDELPK